MNKDLQTILNLVQSPGQLGDEEKAALLKAAKAADKEFEITAFKLDRTEKVKRTTAILLEETIAELEQKRKAVEAQNKELEIESALDKIRSRSMAMQHSDELPETAAVLFSEFRKLGEADLIQATIAVYHEAEGIMEFHSTSWAGGGEQVSRPFNLSIEEPTVLKPVFTAWKAKQRSCVLDLTGDALDGWINYRNKMTGVTVSPEDTAGRRVIGVAFFSQGHLSIGSTKLFSRETINILERFAGVFDGTYTRFLDLQKAEAQARESQIQLALERVRARTMAMQKSEELPEAANLLFQQVQSLGMPAWSAGYCIWDEDKKAITLWMSSEGVLQPPFRAPLTEDPSFIHMREAHERGETFFVDEIGGEELVTHYKYMRTLPVVGEILDSIIEAGHPLPTFQIFHLAYFSKGFLLFITYEPVSEAHEIFKRFGKVFDQTYTRFLDLQKAEAQAREAKIEASLERVRSRTMAMHQTSELQEVIHTVHNELLNLNLSIYGGSFVVINDEVGPELRCWGSGGTANTSEEVHVPHFNMPFCTNLINGIKSGLEFFTEEFSQTEKKEYFTKLFEHKPWSDLSSKQKKETLSSLGGYTRSVAVSKHTTIFVINHNGRKFTEAENDILKRFAKVFEQTYTRFLDLQKAEAQARESQIQLAMERVRARTMAMQHSDELAEVATVLFQQVKALGVPQWTCGFSIFEIDDKEFTWYPGSADGDMLPPVKIPLTEHPVFISFNESRKRGDELFVYEKEGEFQAGHYRYMQSLPGVGEMLQKMLDAGLSFPTFQIDHLANFSHGSLVFITYEPVPEMHDVFKRFAKVFEQTYARFLDLQKAEAQAREAQIEAALERIRSRTMAMQRSEELGEAASLLFKQVSELGIRTLSCGFQIWEENDQYTTAYMSPDGIIRSPFRLPLTEQRYFKKIYDARQRGEEFFAMETAGKELEDMFKYLFTVPGFKKGVDDIESFWLNHAPFQINHSAFFSQGFLSFITPQTVPDAQNIFKRFAKVFEQTYTRFLDLQKAEAQAREAQIEAALEKVRSRSLAMHRADEVKDVIAVLRAKLKELGIAMESRTVLLITLKKGSKDFTQWVARPDVQLTDSTPLYVETPYFDHPILIDFWNTKERGLNFLAKTYTPEEKNSFFKFIFENTASGKASEEEKNWILKTGYYAVSSAIENNSAIVISNFSDKLLSEKENEIVKRFARVFEQAYIRFLDLQKAEAQAREAQIEAALERVRSRSMAMQKSEELKEVIHVVYEQFVHLNIRVEHTGFIMDYKERNDMHIWLADKHAVPFQVTIPYFDCAHWNSFNEAKEKGKDFFTNHLNFEEKNKFYQDLFKLIAGVPEETLEYYFRCPGLAISTVLLESIGLYIENFSGTPYTDEENNTLMRFGKVFQQTYTRFLDLQRAEAQAREAVKRASVDRVRAEIASMRTTADLERITPLIWNELTTLGVPFIRCGVFIMDEEEQQVQSFLSTPDGKAIAAFRQPYSASEISNVVDSWHKKEIYRQHWDEAQFIEFTKNLVQQGAVTSGEKYLTENRPADLYLHFLPFLQGMLYVGNTAPLNDDELQLVQNLADAFSTAYARYEDFNKLEAAKKQVDTALNKLQATQKQLIQSEKMASLGELTAGIAHEIQNPLNFVNNFSEVNKELLEEVEGERHKVKGERDEALESELLNDVKQNTEKIIHHGRRADAIVKGMLQHSRKSEGVKEPTDINTLCDEYLRLSYHGLRAKDKDFNATMKTDFDDSIGNINIIPQDIGRVLLNLYNNAFYAVNERRKAEGERYRGIVTVTTKIVAPSPPERAVGEVKIVVADNGNGIPQNIVDKIFQPFFTTKPTGEGTGLGLSLSYDIIKAHGGEIKVETKEGEGSEFVIQLPN